MYEQTLRYTAAFVEGREVVGAPEPWTYSEFTIRRTHNENTSWGYGIKMMTVEQQSLHNLLRQTSYHIRSTPPFPSPDLWRSCTLLFRVEWFLTMLSSPHWIATHFRSTLRSCSFKCCQTILILSVNNCSCSFIDCYHRGYGSTAPTILHTAHKSLTSIDRSKDKLTSVWKILLFSKYIYAGTMKGGKQSPVA